MSRTATFVIRTHALDMPMQRIGSAIESQPNSQVAIQRACGPEDPREGDLRCSNSFPRMMP